MPLSSRDAMIRGNNPDVIRNTIHFFRRANKESVVALVEGDGDMSFYMNVLNKKYVKIISVGNEKSNDRVSAKEKLIATIEFLNKQKIEGVIAIADKDYDEIIGKKREIDNLIYTDDHDMETMILKTKAYDKFENEYGDIDGIDKFRNVKGSILDEILRCGSIIGKIRLLSIKQDLKLDFKTVDVEDYFNEFLEFDWEAYFKQVLYVSNKFAEKEALYDMLEKENTKYDIWQLCRGHDLTSLIVVFYSKDSKHKIGNRKAKFLKPEVVEAFLRGAYNVPVDFKKTQMFRCLQDWQKNNCGWKLLQDEYMPV